MYLRRQVALWNCQTATRSTSKERQATTDESQQIEPLLSPLRHSLFFVSLPSPSVVDKSLITVVDRGINLKYSTGSAVCMHHGKAHRQYAAFTEAAVQAYIRNIFEFTIRSLIHGYQLRQQIYQRVVNMAYNAT